MRWLASVLVRSEALLWRLAIDLGRLASVLVRSEALLRWLAEALGATAAVIAGAVNVLGVGEVVITGSLTELAPSVMSYLEQAVVKGTMWARFGQVKCFSALRRRTAGLVAVGIDRFVSALPDRVPGASGAGLEKRPTARA